jgi:hypothetical protein
MVEFVYLFYLISYLDKKYVIIGKKSTEYHIYYFFQEKWKPNISFVVGKQADDYTWVNVLGQTVNAGSRRLFSAFSKQELYSEVKH